MPNRNAPSFFVAFGRLASHSAHSPIPLIQSIADLVMLNLVEELLPCRCFADRSFYVDIVTRDVTNDMGTSVLLVSPRFLNRAAIMARSARICISSCKRVRILVHEGARGEYLAARIFGSLFARSRSRSAFPRKIFWRTQKDYSESSRIFVFGLIMVGQRLSRMD